NETFSGGPGTDTVDYSARTNPVLVIVDSTGVGKSGESTTAVTACPTYTAAMGMTPATFSASATESDIILDADVIKAGKASAGSNPINVILGDKSGKLTITGGPGNELFCQGDDTWKNGTDTLTGGGGVDAVDYSLRAHTLNVTMDGKTASGDSTGNSSKGEGDLVGADVQNIYLGSGGSAMTPSVYTGNLLNNTFFSGTGGYATVNGSDGDDTLDEGTEATSTISGVCDPMSTACPDDSHASETFNGGKGTDTVNYRNRMTAIYVKMDGAYKGGAGASGAGANGSENDVIAVDVENLYGGAGADHIEGNLLDNDIEGNGGGDTLCGGAGNDTLLGNNASTTDNETLHGGDCADDADPGAFNMCLGTGSAGTPLVANAQNCQFVSQ
ncbi:MAG: hypothetical protein JOZ99_07030, partial [Actinobacteria bacterium]|nr:hypothetical protein [Actinomycetota bacterium]